jgi:type VI secretion system protein VasG
MIELIARLQLGRIEKRVRENHGVPFTYTDDVGQLIRGRFTELESGGRMIDAILSNSVLQKISEEFLTRMMDSRPVGGIQISVENGQFVYGFE